MRVSLFQGSHGTPPGLKPRALSHGRAYSGARMRAQARFVCGVLLGAFGGCSPQVFALQRVNAFRAVRCPNAFWCAPLGENPAHKIPPARALDEKVPKRCGATITELTAA
jgi:hypothetical protein